MEESEEEEEEEEEREKGEKEKKVKKAVEEESLFHTEGRATLAWFPSSVEISLIK